MVREYDECCPAILLADAMFRENRRECDSTSLRQPDNWSAWAESAIGENPGQRIQVFPREDLSALGKHHLSDFE